MNESSIQAKIIKTLEANGCYVVKTIRTNHAGVPDIIACHHGRFIAIEVKQPGNKPTELQKHHLAKIAESGGITLIATAPEQAINLLTEIKDSPE